MNSPKAMCNTILTVRCCGQSQLPWWPTAPSYSKEGRSWQAAHIEVKRSCTCVTRLSILLSCKSDDLDLNYTQIASEWMVACAVCLLLVHGHGTLHNRCKELDKKINQTPTKSLRKEMKQRMSKSKMKHQPPHLFLFLLFSPSIYTPS